MPFNPLRDLPPWWVVPVTISSPNGETLNIAGVQYSATSVTVKPEFRCAGSTAADQAARALEHARDQYSRTFYTNAVYGTPYPGRA